MNFTNSFLSCQSYFFVRRHRQVILPVKLRDCKRSRSFDSSYIGWDKETKGLLVKKKRHLNNLLYTRLKTMSKPTAKGSCKALLYEAIVLLASFYPWKRLTFFCSWKILEKNSKNMIQLQETLQNLFERPENISKLLVLALRGSMSSKYKIICYASSTCLRKSKNTHSNT